MMTRRILVCLLFLHSLSALSAWQADSLYCGIDSLVRHHLPAGSNVGIYAYDLTSGKELYAYQADKLGHPASTMKLLTAVTALAQPEADEPFRTAVWYQGTIGNDTLHGDLYVVGGFDPEFDDAAMDSLANEVSRLPFSVIQGKIYGDVSTKDSLYWGSGWLWDDAPYAFQPSLSPLMLDKGTLTITAFPGKCKGDTARLQCVPASSYYHLDNRTETNTPQAGKFRLSRDWLVQGNHILAEGDVRSQQTSTISLHASEQLFMHVFIERIRARGIQCTAEYEFRPLEQDGQTNLIAVYETPVARVLEQMMKESDNLNAEAMLWRVGRQASGKKHVSAEDGLSAVRALIEQQGYPPEQYGLADGSGLSNYDYVSPEVLVAFLRFAYADSGIFQKLYKSLPIGGVDGTLKNRMRRGTLAFRNVHAKTGSFTGISCLAGYLNSAGNHCIAFAIMNQNVLSGRKARAFQDAVCEELLKSP